MGDKERRDEVIAYAKTELKKYNDLHPFETADYHSPPCGCGRCVKYALHACLQLLEEAK